MTAGRIPTSWIAACSSGRLRPETSLGCFEFLSFGFDLPVPGKCKVTLDICKAILYTLPHDQELQAQGSKAIIRNGQER